MHTQSHGTVLRERQHMQLVAWACNPKPAPALVEITNTRRGESAEVGVGKSTGEATRTVCLCEHLGIPMMDLG